MADFLLTAAREFKVDPKRIREWCKQKSVISTLKKKRGNAERKRLKGGGRKVHDDEMEDALFSWIAVMRENNLRVSRRMIRAKALDYSSIEGFRASNGWLVKFLHRNGLSLRRKTSISQSLPADYIPKLVSFIVRLRNIQREHKYQESNIIAMDETACWMDMPSSTTIDHVGARSISLKTTGHDKDHYTVILTARADGTKLKPYIVFKGKGTRLMKQLQCIPGIIVRFSTNGWMNTELTIDYLHSVVGRLAFNKRLLVWDAYKCHTCDAVKEECTRMHLDTAVVPGGLTKHIQAADVVWNGPFKAAMRECYDNWISEPSLREYTKGGNPKPPQRSLICNWIKQCWDAIPTSTIKESFLSCAISTSPTGPDISKIHCLKEGQPCHEGKSALEEELKADTLVEDVGDSDPFASDEDEAEEYNNEFWIEEDDEESGDKDESAVESCSDED